MLNTLLFIDDQISLATTEDDLQRMLHSLNNTANEFNMETSDKKKTKCLLKGHGQLALTLICIVKLQINSQNLANLCC